MNAPSPIESPPSGPVPNLRRSRLTKETVGLVLSIGGVLYMAADKLMDFGVTRHQVANIQQLVDKQIQQDTRITDQGYKIANQAVEMAAQAKATERVEAAVGTVDRKVDKLTEVLMQLRVTGRR